MGRAPKRSTRKPHGAWVSPEFFSLYGIPIARGRGFQASDAFASVIVSERFARALWREADPLGRTIRFDNQKFQVFGLARVIH